MSSASYELLLELSRSLVLYCTRCQVRAYACVHRADARNLAARALRACCLDIGTIYRRGPAPRAWSKTGQCLLAARFCPVSAAAAIERILWLYCSVADTSRSLDGVALRVSLDAVGGESDVLLIGAKCSCYIDCALHIYHRCGHHGL